MKYFTVLFIAVFSLGMLNAQSSKEARQLLDDAKAQIKSYKNQQISFDNQMEIPSADPEKGSVIRSKNGVISIQGDSYRLELDGIIFIYDTKNLYIIDPDIEEVDVTSLEEDIAISPSSILNEYEKGYSLKMSGTKTIDGKKVQFISMKPIGESEIEEVQLGIYEKTKKLYIYKITQQNEIITTLTITDYKTNIELPANTFTFDKSEWDGFYINK